MIMHRTLIAILLTNLTAFAAESNFGTLIFEDRFARSESQEHRKASPMRQRSFCACWLRKMPLLMT